MKPIGTRHRPPILALASALLAASSPIHAGDDLTLYRKAALFDVDMVERFMIEGQIAPKLRLPSPEWPHPTYNMPDNAYMTGLWCAAQSWRYAMTGSPEAKRLARLAMRAMNRLVDVTGRRGLPARAFIPIEMPWLDDGDWRPSPDGKHRWRGDVSSDQIDGLLFGYYVYFTTVCSEAEEPEVAAKVGDIVSAILDNGLTIRDLDGRVTTWGHYEPAYVGRREPMNALLMLQMLKIAAYVTRDEKFQKEYGRLIEDEHYAEIAERSRALSRPERINHSDDVLIAIALHPLLELERDGAIREHYLKAARRWFLGDARYPGVSVEANPFFSFLWHRWTGEAAYDAAAVETLRRAPLDMKWSRATIATYARRFGFTFDPKPESPEPAPGALVPIDRRRKAWSFLVENPYLEAGDRSTESDMEYQGLDYSLSYWFGLAHGMIPEDAARTSADVRRSRIGDQPN